MYSWGKWQKCCAFIISQRARFRSGFWCSPLWNIKIHSHLVLYGWDPRGNQNGNIDPPCTPIVIIIHLCDVMFVTLQYYYYEMLRHWEFTMGKLIMHSSRGCDFCVAEHAINSLCIQHYWRKTMWGETSPWYAKIQKIVLIRCTHLVRKYVKGATWRRVSKARERYRNGTQDH